MILIEFLNFIERLKVQINRTLDINFYRTFYESKRNQFVNSLKALKEEYAEVAFIQLEKIKEKIKTEFNSNLFDESFY